MRNVERLVASMVVAVFALTAARGLAASENHPAGVSWRAASGADIAAVPYQPTAPFPTLPPTQPFPTVPPDVPTPSLYTPTPTFTPAPTDTATATPTASPTVSVTPSAIPSATATTILGLDWVLFAPYCSQFHDLGPSALNDHMVGE